MIDDARVAVADAHSCPRCMTRLVHAEEQPPWCTRCEWNLDALPPVQDMGWFARLVRRLDHRAGFRADLRLATVTSAEALAAPRPTAGEALLWVISAVLILVPAALLGAGVELIIWGGRPNAFPALVLFGMAWLLRVRLGRVRSLTKHAYRLDPARTPALHDLIGRVAAATGAPRPHIVVLNSDLNAFATTVGLRRRRVLALGVPLLVAMRGQERVALIAHELGHLLHEDATRGLFTQPALTMFGRLARLLQGPRLPQFGLHGPLAPLVLVWKLVGPIVALPVWFVHFGLHVMAARDDRRAEVRADLVSAHVAGTTATLNMLDDLVLLPAYAPMISGTVTKGAALKGWRDRVAHVRGKHAADMPALRQLTARVRASLFASHPAPGRRHQVVSQAPYQPGQVVLTEAEVARVDAEIAPYAEAERAALAEAYEM
jgi:heat shock protein HtpX